MDKQLMAFAFAGGLDTKTDEVHVSPVKLAALSNGVFSLTGSISKRWGYKKLNNAILGAGSGTIQSIVALNEFNGLLLAYDGQSAYSYSPAQSAWTNGGLLVSVIQRNESITRNPGQQLSPDTATINGMDVYAYEDSRGGGALNYCVIDSATAVPLLRDSVLKQGSNYIRPKALSFAAANAVVILYVNTSANTIEAALVSKPTSVTTMTVLPALGTATFFDAQVIGSQLYVIYYNGSATLLSSFDANLSLLWTRTLQSATGAPGQLNVVADTAFTGGPLIWVTYPTSSTTATCKSFLPNGTLVSNPGVTVITTAGTIQSIAAIPRVTNNPALSILQVFAESLGSATQNQSIYSATVNTSNVVGPSGVFLRSVGLASKPFVYAGQTYLNVAFQTQQQPTYFTVNLAGQVVSKVNAGLAGGLVASSDFMLPECSQIATGIFRYANLVKGAVNTEAGNILALLGVNATTLDFIDSNHFLSAAINGGFYTVGGIVQSFDGSQYVEAGFNVYPEPIAVSTSASGGLITAGVYNYCVTYEWIDNNGLRLPSTPSVAVAITTTGSTSSNTLTIPTLRLTKKGNVQIVVYRTTANGALLYRVSSVLAPLYNNPAADTVTFVDTLNDSSITSNGLMYTQPLQAASTNANPVLPNAAPPACSLIATYADRIFLGGLDDPYLLWYSQQTIGTAPAQFSASLTFRLDPDGGGITALARMDDKLVIFKQTAIFILVGQGPTATGDQNDFIDAVQVPSGGIGCATASSVVLTPLGLMFDSGNGIYLLDRGLNVSYKGAPARAYTDPNSAQYVGPITSGTVLPNQWVIFTTSDKFGLQLVYDFYYDQWGTFTGTGTCVDSVVLPGSPPLLVYANSDGNVYQQTPGVFTDNGTPIVLSLTTAWLDATGNKQGYQRVYEAFILGKYKGSHTLNVDVATNYNPVFTTRAAIPVDTSLGISTFGSSSPFGNEVLFGDGANSFPDDTNYQFRVDVVQKCEAIRFRIADVQSSPGNEGFSLASLVLRVGAKRTGHKNIPAAKQFGAV